MERARPVERGRPAGPLDRFVRLWTARTPAADGLVHLVPTGTVSLVIDLAEDQIRWYQGGRSHRTGGAAIGGAYATPFAVGRRARRDLVVARFMPGGAAPFLQGPVDEFTGTHVPLEQVWGRAAGELRERLHQTP